MESDDWRECLGSRCWGFQLMSLTNGQSPLYACLNHQQSLSGPIAGGDFTNISTGNAADGVYTIGGEAVTLGEIIDLGHAETNFDPVLDIDAGGIKLRQTGPSTFVSRQFAINDPLLSELLTDGFTTLMEFYFDEGGSVGVGVSIHDDPTWNFDAGGSAQWDNGGIVSQITVTDKNFNPAQDDDNFPLEGQENKLAITVTNDRVSGSINGSSPITVAGPGLDPAMASIVFTLTGAGDARMRSFAFYEPADDVDLPALST